MFGENAEKAELMILQNLLVTCCELLNHAIKYKVTPGVSHIKYQKCLI
jgi:hypothetical protein